MRCPSTHREVVRETRRSIIAAISICVHAIVLAALMTQDLWRPIAEWPTPRSAMAFVDDVARPVHLVDVHGNVVRTQVLKSIPLLDDAALVAVQQWRFSPTLLNGVPVPIVMTVTVNFTLQ